MVVSAYIRHPDKEFCNYYQSLLMVMDAADAATSEKQVDKKQDKDKNMITPHHGYLCKHAHEKLSKAESLMKKGAMEKLGEDKVCMAAELVHVPLKDTDKAKVDTGHAVRLGWLLKVIC